MTHMKSIQLFAVCVCGMGALAAGSPTAEAGIVPQLFWANQNAGGSGNGAIWRVNLDGSGLEAIHVFGGGAFPKDVAVDPVGGKVYWTRNGSIQRANLDGSSVEVVVGGLVAPTGVDLDVAGGKVYWFEEFGIRRANLIDGSGVEDLVTNGLSIPGEVAVDEVEGKIYWTNRNTNGSSKIQRANLDGSTVENIYNPQFATKLTGIAVDVLAGQFWTETRDDKVQRRTSSGLVDIFVEGGTQNVHGGIALDVPGGEVYWSYGNGTIQRANLDGSSRTTFISNSGALSNPQGMAVLVPEPATLGLGLLAVGGLAVVRRRRRTRVE